MVEVTPTARLDSIPAVQQANDIADKLREGLTPQPIKATQADSKDQIASGAKGTDVQANENGNDKADNQGKNQTVAQADIQAGGKVDVNAALHNMRTLTTRPDGTTVANLQRHMLEDKGPSALENEIANNATARRIVAFGEGAGYAVPGALKAVANDLTHPTQLLEKGLTAATIGVGMRLLLPKTGAGKAIVGTIMGYYMVKDALHPVINGWEEAGKAKNMTEVNKAAQHIGDGLGAFAWDAYFGSKVGLKAEKLTGGALDVTLGTQRFAAFEKFKVDVDNKFVSKPLEKLLSPVTRMTSWASDKMAKPEEHTKIEFQAVKHKFAEVEAQNAVSRKNVDLHLKGAVGADGSRLGYTETLDLLTKGHDPSTVKSTEVYDILGTGLLDYPGNRVNPLDIVSQNYSKTGITGSTTPEVAKTIMGPTEAPGNLTGGGDAAKPPADASGLAGGDKTGGGGTPPPGKPYVTKAEQEVNAVVLGKMAGMNKTLMDAWTDKRVLIEDAKERLAGPVHAAVSPEYKAMDKGYLLVRNQMMQIGGQIASEEDLKYVMPLFSRLSMASVQHISDGLTNTASLKYQLDLMALETHSELVRNMKKAGIDPDVVLRSKNPAVFSVSHDGGEGPHTMRQIDGVWNVDHVLYPRNMVDTRSTTASGIYSHELGHDQYGGILKFDEGIREHTITDAVRKGLGSRADDKIHFPGVGDVTKQALIEAIFKAQADENTADIWGAAWSGHNSGGALGMLLQSLRTGGKLETRNIFGTEFKSAENPYGFEPHAFDAIRPKIVAAVMKSRANGDATVIEYANALERYATEASKTGDYLFANADKPGETITIPRKDMEDVIPFLIDAQLNTKLSALQGHSFAEILPDLPSNLAKMNTLADLMVDAVKNNKKPNQIPFDVSQYSIIQVFGAGLPAASKLVAGGMEAKEANAAVNVMSDYLRGLYHGNDPHVDPLKPTALQTIRLSSPKTLLSGSAQAGRDFVHSTGKVLGRTGQLSDWLASRSTSWAARVGTITVDDSYRNALKSQKLAMSGIDMTPVVIVEQDNNAAMTAQPETGSWLKNRDVTRENMTADEKARKEVLKGS